MGEKFSARSGGGQGEGSGSLWREPEISDPQISQPSVVSEGHGAQALPVTETLEEPKPQSLSPVQRPDLEWDGSYLGFTPDNYHTEIARQLERRQDDVAPFTSNFARQLVQKDIEHRLSSVPMTIPQIVKTYQQAKTMDSEANKKSLTVKQIVP